MNLNDVLLTVFSASSPIAAAVVGLAFYRENKRKKQLEIQREEGQIVLDENTRNRLVQEAANLSQEREERREEWWGRQIDTLRREIDSERKLSNRRFRRLNQLEEWATRHVMWDRKAWSTIMALDNSFPPPPVLPDELNELT